MADSLFWGDLHNHNAVGYAKGSLARSYAIARSHLDVFAFTGHARWHDVPAMEGDRHQVWLQGCQRHTEAWPEVCRAAQEANLPGEFVCFRAYEWHSSQYGDYCVYYPADAGELVLPDTLAELQAHVRAAGALMLPHHPGYAPGWRGIVPEAVDLSISPTCEIFSEHGNAESDDGTFAYWRHSQGRQVTGHTLAAMWRAGLRFGVTAGTDDHLGFPGAYGEGITGFWAPELSRAAIWEALRTRRVYGCTGDRIALDFTVNDAPMGSEIPFTAACRLAIDVASPDVIETVELWCGDQVVARDHPCDGPPAWDGTGHVRVEYGWGPWLALGLDRIASWTLTFELSSGAIRRVLPCWQSGPFDEDRRHRIVEQMARRCVWESYTSRLQAIGEMPTNAMIFELDAPAEATVTLTAEQPAPVRVEATVGELLAHNAIAFCGPFPSESVVLHRAVPAALSTASLVVNDRLDAPDYYRVRVRQRNGQMAWSSPVWVG